MVFVCVAGEAGDASLKCVDEGQAGVTFRTFHRNFLKLALGAVGMSRA